MRVILGRPSKKSRSGSNIWDLVNPGSRMEKIGYNSKFSDKILLFLTCSLLGIVTVPDRHAIDDDPDPEI